MEFLKNFEGFAPLSSISNVTVKKSIVIHVGFYLTCIFFSSGHFQDLFVVPKCYFISVMSLGMGLFSFIVLGAWCVLSI